MGPKGEETYPQSKAQTELNTGPIPIYEEKQVIRRGERVAAANPTPRARGQKTLGREKPKEQPKQVVVRVAMSTRGGDDEFYLRYYVGHKGKFGHEFLEFEFRPDGKLRYANNSNYKNDTMIRKEVFVSRAVLREARRIIQESDVSSPLLILSSSIRSSISP